MPTSLAIIVILVEAAVLAFSGRANFPETKAVAKTAAPSVGVIVAERLDGISTGTAFVAAERFVLTTHHVVASATRIFLKFPEHPVLEPKVAATDVINDFAVLAIPALPIRPLPLGDIAQVREGEKIVVITSQIEAQGTQLHNVTDGTVSAVRAGLLQIQAPIVLGSAGGPVLNLRGEVIGLVRGQLPGEQAGINAVTPTNAARPLLGAALFLASLPPPPVPTVAETQPTLEPAPSPVQTQPGPAAAPSSVAQTQQIPASPPASSAAATDPFLVLPGQSIGAVKLGMQIQDVAALLGSQKSGKKLSDGSIIYAWFEPPGYDGLGVRAMESGTVERIWILNDAKYGTKDRLRVGSTEAEVLAVMGEPTSVSEDSQAKTRTLRYDALGVWFTIQRNPQYGFYNAVYEIGIMWAK